jgi:hypothetical protein|tara:strand:+ start:74 stop:724 length:651 start_codon:yes stop_codon:yes gene_type:complete
MTRKIDVPIHMRKIYHPELRAAVMEDLEDFPGKDEQAFAVGMAVSVEDGVVEFDSRFHAWWVNRPYDAIVCGDMAQNVPSNIRKRCAHVAFATVGDNTARSVLRHTLTECLELFDAEFDHGDYDALFLRQGILAHFGNLTYELSMRCPQEPCVLDKAACRSGIIAICPEDASHHEKMAFLDAANGYLKRKIAEELEGEGASSYRDLFNGVDITLVF